MDLDVKRAAIIALLIVAVVFLPIVIYATLTVQKPFITEFSFAESDVKIEAFNFVFNGETWDVVNVTLRNYGVQNRICKVRIYIYNATGHLVAEGVLTGVSVNAGATKSIEVPLTWIGGAGVTDAAKGKITVEAQ